LKDLPVHSAQAQQLTAPSVDAINTFDQPNAVTLRALACQTQGGVLTLTLPAKSVSVVDLQ
jgi:alpha-N-arabinofuranosidase